MSNYTRHHFLISFPSQDTIIYLFPFSLFLKKEQQMEFYLYENIRPEWNYHKPLTLVFFDQKINTHHAYNLHKVLHFKCLRGALFGFYAFLSHLRDSADIYKSCWRHLKKYFFKRDLSIKHLHLTKEITVKLYKFKY